MSTATIAPNLTHLPHTAHPLPLREQAFTLHCQGLRSPAIAQALGVPERTVRAWIAAALDDLKDDIQLNRREQLLLAVERQHQLTAVCWEQFEHEAAARDALLDAALQTLRAAADAPEHPITVHLPASSLAPRYLSLILQADKEANRLLGLHTLAKLQLLATDAPEAALTDAHSPAESATASANSEIAAKTATASPVTSAIPAESATPVASGLPAGIGTPANPHSPLAPPPAVSSHHGSAKTATTLAAADDPECAAESATASIPLCSSVSSVVKSHSPAKTATAPSPTHRAHHPRRTPHPWMM